MTISVDKTSDIHINAHGSAVNTSDVHISTHTRPDKKIIINNNAADNPKVQPLITSLDKVLLVIQNIEWATNDLKDQNDLHRIIKNLVLLWTDITQLQISMIHTKTSSDFVHRSETRYEPNICTLALNYKFFAHLMCTQERLGYGIGGSKS